MRDAQNVRGNGHGAGWRVEGRQRVWVLSPDGGRRSHTAGDVVMFAT